MLGDRPSTAIEECCDCSEPTGRAGRADDSLYCARCESGPFCLACYDRHVADTVAARHECMAFKFRRQTGMLPPWKDSPAAAMRDDAECNRLWREFVSVPENWA